jgi:hypothetical protein
MGYPNEAPLPKPRKAFDQIACFDKFR